MSATLLDELCVLASIRSRLSAAEAIISAKEQAFDAENAAVIAQAKELSVAAAAAEANVRALARVQYDATGDKAPVPGAVEVKLFSVMRYEEGAALAWATQTGMALTPAALDRKAFEKIAKATPLPFVQYAQEPRVSIMSDLDTPLAAFPSP